MLSHIISRIHYTLCISVTDMVWAGLRPGIQARIKPFARENGRFASIDELFKKAQDVEIRSNRNKRAGTTQNQPASTAEKRHGNNGSNSGSNGGKTKKKRPYHDTPPTPSRNYRQNLPPAPWVDRETRDKRREKALCWRCGGDHKTVHCPKYSRVDIPPSQDRQDRDKRQKPAADTQTQQAKN
jgi:hypothetical protein